MADGMISTDGMNAGHPDHAVEFIQLIPDGRPPKRANRSAGGYLPGRAMRYCEAITSATGYGYWVFPPIDLQLLWDGEDIFWTYGDCSEWLPLSGTPSSAVQFPNYAERFDAAAPPELAGYSPPFMTALTEPGTIQIWSGIVARTKPGWSLMVRPPANLPGIPGLVGWEGVVETDHWFGPLFGVFRITRTDAPIYLKSHIPFMQFQPVPQLSYRDDRLNDYSCKTIDGMSAGDWSDLGRVLLPNPEPDANLGDYAVQTRKRRVCPFHTQVVHAAIAEGSKEAIADRDEDQSVTPAALNPST